MKLAWLIISFQFVIISYMLISSKSSQDLPKQTSGLERLRYSACSSALISKNCFNFTRPTSESCKLGFTFAALMDIRLRFTDLTSRFNPPAESKPHEELNTHQKMLEAMAYSFSTGRAAEFRVSKELFELILKKLEGIESWQTLGGNAASMCLRASYEGCSSYLVAPLTAQMTGFFPQNVHFLNDLYKSPDFHIILEYREGETWGKFRAPRSNRFYMNHDTLNINPDVLAAATRLEDVQVLALGGLQLIEGTETEDLFLENTLNVVQGIKAKSVKTHIEMGDFHSYSYFKKLQPLFKQADSIGMNEQELGILLCHLKKIKFAGYPSKAPIKKYLDDLSDLIAEMKKADYLASRIHLHTISSQVICASDEWDDSLVAAARSALVAGQFSCNSTDIQHSAFEFYEGDDWKSSEITKCWQERHMKCCLALVPTCLEVVQVSGLGDNISATGLAYHRIKS